MALHQSLKIKPEVWYAWPGWRPTARSHWRPAGANWGQSGELSWVYKWEFCLKTRKQGESVIQSEMSVGWIVGVWREYKQKFCKVLFGQLTVFSLSLRQNTKRILNCIKVNYFFLCLVLCYYIQYNGLLGFTTIHFLGTRHVLLPSDLQYIVTGMILPVRVGLGIISPSLLSHQARPSGDIVKLSDHPATKLPWYYLRSYPDLWPGPTRPPACHSGSGGEITSVLALVINQFLGPISSACRPYWQRDKYI